MVVGCAPTALAEVSRLLDAGRFEPALVIGMPVGYVGAAESKEDCCAPAPGPACRRSRCAANGAARRSPPPW